MHQRQRSLLYDVTRMLADTVQLTQKEELVYRRLFDICADRLLAHSSVVDNAELAARLKAGPSWPRIRDLLVSMGLVELNGAVVTLPALRGDT